MIGILRDISQQKAAEASLIAARNAAQTASLVKSEFLAKMSHELRTPLNAVIGFSQLMSRSGTLLPDQQRNLDIIHRSGHHLLTLINDVLALSKIEAGGTHLDAADTDLARLLEDVADMLRIRAVSSGLALELALDGVPAAVRVDAVKLRQVLINLLGNALKFTYEGRVRLQVGGQLQQGREAGQARIQFVISDTGIGMAPDDLQRIFEPFVQVGAHASESGTGLGLAISRQYVELLGGVLQVESEVGRGSVFRFTLALPLADAVPAVPASGATAGAVLGLAPEQRGKRVLVADDDREAQLLLGELLEPLGFVVQFAGNGLEALARVDSFAPQLVLMDWRMPELDGLATIRRIRSQPDGGRMRIIMCTASAFEEQCTLALEAGADAFLRKPLNAAELYARIEQLLELRLLRAGEADDVAAAMAGGAASGCPGAGLDGLATARTGPVLKEELAALPAAVRCALKEGAVELDQQRLAGALAAIEAHQPDLARRLRHMTQAFRYRELFALLTDDGAGA